MNEALEILKKINWFLEPIADTIWFLFTKPLGQWLLIAGFLAYITLPAFDAVRMRSLAHKAASNFGSGRLNFTERIYVFFSAVGRNLAKIVSNAPVLIISLLVLFLVVGISKGITTMDKFVQNRKKIKEMQTVLKQLDTNYKVAEMEVLERDYRADSTTIQIRFYDSSLHEFIEDEQKLELAGGIIYFDAMILNFEYSEIAENSKRNLVLPYRIFTNSIPQADAVPLKFKDEEGVPYIYKRNNKEVYGMEVERYNNYIDEFVKFLTDKDYARKAGVRNYSGGNAVHTYRPVRKGQTYVIKVEQTGGLVIDLKKDF